MITSNRVNSGQRIEPIGYDSKRNSYWLIGGSVNIAMQSFVSYQAI
jgi:hypothetical protein